MTNGTRRRDDSEDIIDRKRRKHIIRDDNDSEEDEEVVEVICDDYLPDGNADVQIEVGNNAETNNADSFSDIEFVGANTHSTEPESRRTNDDGHVEVVTFDGSDEDNRGDDTDDIIIVQVPQKNPKPQSPIKDNTSEVSGSVSKSMQDVQCVICMDKITDAVATNCGHVFCKDCIYQALATSHSAHNNRNKKVGSCPVCRKDVPYSKLRWLKIRYK